MSKILRRAETSIADLDERLNSHYNRQLRDLEMRLEFARQEILTKLQPTLRRSQDIDARRDLFKPRIISPEKVEAQRERGLRLNVGCGDITLDDYINIDYRDLPGVDIVADATAIPVKSGGAIEIIASHLVEHFSPFRLENVLLPYWRSLLAPGGQLIIVAWDGAAMLNAVSEGKMTFEAFREALFGAQEYEADFYLNLITLDTITESLKRSGFKFVEVNYCARPKGLFFELRVTAGQVVI